MASRRWRRGETRTQGGATQRCGPRGPTAERPASAAAARRASLESRPGSPRRTRDSSPIGPGAATAPRRRARTSPRPGFRRRRPLSREPPRPRTRRRRAAARRRGRFRAPYLSDAANLSDAPLRRRLSAALSRGHKCVCSAQLSCADLRQRLRRSSSLVVRNAPLIAYHRSGSSHKTARVSPEASQGRPEASSVIGILNTRTTHVGPYAPHGLPRARGRHYF